MPPLARELPGFYYDEEKNRYFPLSRRPTGRASSSYVRASPASSIVPSHPKRNHGSIKAPTSTPQINVEKATRRTLANLSSTALLRRAALSPSSGTRAMIHREYLSRKLVASNTSPYSQDIPSGCDISSYSIDATDPRSQVIGMEDGSYWLGQHKNTMNEASHALELLRDRNHDHSVDYPRPTRQWHWTARLSAGIGLESKITSTSLKDGILLVTSLGSPACVSLGNRRQGSSPSELTNVTVANRMFEGDMWSGILTKRGLALGMSKQIYVLESCEHFPQFSTPRGPLRKYMTSTDILSVASHEDQVFAGGRNGVVLQYDTRTPELKGLELLHARSSVTNITPLRSWELMVTAINGDIDIHDLRVLRSSVDGGGLKSVSSVVQLHGHKSSLSLKTPIALYPTQDFVFVGGEDGYIRAWNTRTGDLLNSISPSLAGESSIFATHFSSTIAGMHFSDTSSEPWPSLWIASGTTVEQWELGRQLMQSN